MGWISKPDFDRLRRAFEAEMKRKPWAYGKTVRRYVKKRTTFRRFKFGTLDPRKKYRRPYTYKGVQAVSMADKRWIEKMIAQRGRGNRQIPRKYYR